MRYLILLVLFASCSTPKTDPYNLIFMEQWDACRKSADDNGMNRSGNRNRFISSCMELNLSE